MTAPKDAPVSRLSRAAFDKLDRRSRKNRDRQITQMVVSGASIDQVAGMLAGRTRSAAMHLVRRVLDEQLPTFDPALALRLDLARLDQLLSSWWEQALAGHEIAALVVLSVLDLRTRLELEVGPGLNPSIPGRLLDVDPSGGERVVSLITDLLRATEPVDVQEAARALSAACVAGAPESYRELAAHALATSLEDGRVADAATETALCDALVATGITHRIGHLDLELRHDEPDPDRPA